ncbi:MAG: hypothetical protein WA941_08490, partial [Nitrososphaeraceae archaeon]
PSVEDKQRLDILSKEINERLEEFGNIIFKTLANKTENKVSKVSFERSELGNMAVSVVKKDPNAMPEIVGGGCYRDPPGVCFPC